MNELVANKTNDEHIAKIKESKNLISEELIKSARGSAFYAKSNLSTDPLWVSSIAHHLAGMDCYNGIRFEFVSSGDLVGVKSSSQLIITNFIVSISETLLDANNVRNVSAQVISSEHGVVVRVVATPVISSRPVLDVISISTIRKIFGSTNSFRVTINNIPGGVLKLVMLEVK